MTCLSQAERTSRRRRRESLLLLAFLASTMTGCLAHQSSSARPDATRDPLDVSGLAPAINGGLKKSPPPPALSAPSPPANVPVRASAPPEVPKPSSLPSASSPQPAAAAPARDSAVNPASFAKAQEKPQGPPASVMPVESPEVSPLAGATPPTIPVVGESYPIDLAAALRLADAENPTIAEARVVIQEALAGQMIARSLLFPSLNAGGNYHGHEGNLQRSSGKILNLSEQSFYFGGGARTLAAESVAVPAVNIFSPLADAIYEPLAARQRVAGTRFEASSTANTVLLEVANLYMDLLGAEASLEARRRTADEGDQIAKITYDFAVSGEGRPADADRADIERRLLQAEVQRGEEDVAVASARLSRRLNLDPSIRLRTMNVPLAPFQLIDATLPSEDLIIDALTRRPDLAARNASIGVAEARLREELARPWLPTIWLGFSGGVFGGGSNIVPPDLGNFGGRTDFDVRLYWTVLNFGAGNLSLQKNRRALVGQAEADRIRTMNTIRAEVLSAKAQSLAQDRQVQLNQAAVDSADKGYREDRSLLKESLSRPIEAVNSLRLVNTARLNLIQAIVKANQAQLALFVALGSPPPVPEGTPLPAPPPIANPLHSPIVNRVDPVPDLGPVPAPMIGH